MGRSREGRETARALECARRKCSLRASFGGLRMSGWRIGTFVAPSAPRGSGWNRSLACRTHVSPTRDVKISVFHFSGKLNEISEFQNFMGRSREGRETARALECARRKCSLRASFGGLRMSGWRIGTFVAPSAPQGSGWNRSLACRTHVSPTRDVKISVFHFSGKLNEISEFQNFRISWVGAGRGAKQPEHSSAREGNVRYARPSGASGCRDGVSAHSWHPPPREDPVGIAHSPVAHTFRQPATSKFQFSTFPGN